MKITKELISDLLATALEGGSNYWYLLGDIDSTHFVKGDTLADNLARSFMADEEYELEVYDIESDEDEPELLGTIVMHNILKAFDVMAEDYPHAYARIKTGDYDAEDGDIWFQIATMGEVVFG